VNIRISWLYFLAFISLSSSFVTVPTISAESRKPGSSDMSGYSVLYTFCSTSGCADGDQPRAGLIRDDAGSLYGTTADGGAYQSGNVFKIDNLGNETVLYSFCKAGTSCADGRSPEAGLIRDGSGNLYGTTAAGGASDDGTVFKIDNTGNETVLYSFCSVPNCADGWAPYAGLVQDTSGNLYGTTADGGANGKGTVFRLDSAGNETVLYSFCSLPNCADGAIPFTNLIRDAGGNLYGTTFEGGNGTNPDCPYGATGCGTAFKIDPTGQETVLHAFCSTPRCSDGASPHSPLLQDAQGNLYGTTYTGEVFDYEGAIFKLDPTGREMVLFSFCSDHFLNCTDGSLPGGGLIRDMAGNLYGTAFGGGINYAGAVFKLDSAGHETLLYSFCPEGFSSCPGGYYPVAGVVQDAAGNLYGTTSQGGTNNSGTVFRLALGGSNATIAVTSSPSSAYGGQSVTFSATVSGADATPTGLVTFDYGRTALGTAALNGGQASMTTTFTKAGNAVIVASYSGDQNYKAVSSKPLKQIVTQYTTGTLLASGLNPSTYGQTVSLIATVSSAGPTPTGTVTFKNGSKSFGGASLNSGVAQITISTLPAGTFTITAIYGGDAPNAKSTSPSLTQVVNQATSTTTLASLTNPSKTGQVVKVTATVTSPTTKPTGTVTFMDGSTVLGTKSVPMATGKAVYSTSTLSAGSHNITVVYAGTSNVTGSTSPVLVQTVN
jgi:uncharacterized repeat protein (TIGR03803 family)